MEILFNEQDVVDSVCVFTAIRENARPEQVDVDLEFHPSHGFAATADLYGRKIRYNEQDVIDAISVYLRDYHQFIPEDLLVDLSFSDGVGIIASIKIRN